MDEDGLEAGNEPRPEDDVMTQINELAAALAKAQGEFGPIKRDKTVSVQTRTGGKYTFTYAPLESILKATLPALNKHGLSITQSVEAADGTEYVVTRLMHQNAEIANRVRVIAREDGPQAYGSALTYARRYGITLLLGICADDDDDANAAEGNSAEPVRRPTQPRSAGPTPAERFREALNTGFDQAIYDVHEELVKDEELYQQQWKLLSASERRAIKEAIARVKGATVMANGRAA